MSFPKQACTFRYIRRGWFYQSRTVCGRLGIASVFCMSVDLGIVSQARMIGHAFPSVGILLRTGFEDLSVEEKVVRLVSR